MTTKCQMPVAEVKGGGGGGLGGRYPGFMSRDWEVPWGPMHHG